MNNIINAKIYIERNEDSKYPTELFNYSPSECYPEYLFPNELAESPNSIYDIVRTLFKNMGLDSEHYGTNKWNPLGYYIKPGDSVLLKPNWVMDHNPEPVYHSMDCLVTHPSIIRAVLDYVCIALSGDGNVTVADAPVMECNFDLLQNRGHYSLIQQFYRTHGINVSFVDMRGKINFENPNKIVGDKAIKNDFFGVLVDVGGVSAFEELSDYRISNLRALNNDPSLLTDHHKRGLHEYLIHPNVLHANVIINLPKPKAHRKAGLTACAKNFVGINVRKEYLPHATIGSQHGGGGIYA